MLDGIQLSSLFWDLGRWVGLVGLVCLSLLIFSGDTARFFDRYFGFDMIVKLQRKFSLITAIFILLHPIFFMLSTKSVTDYIIPDFTVVPFALGVVAFYAFAVIMIASRLYKRISYTLWQYLHILTYVLLFFGLYHAANWGSDSNLIYIKVLYSILLVTVVVGIIYRTQHKIRKRYTGKFHVKEIKPETKDVFTLVLTPEKKFKFKAGQFCFLRINKNKLYARHPFTISSSPQKKELRFTIKNTGRFTKAAAKLKEGEEIKLDGPFGTFTIWGKKKDLVFIAGGVGVTPFLSIIKDNLFKGNQQNITLLYGAKTEADIIHKNELDGINTEWFKKVYILSQEQSNNNLFARGHITKELIKDSVRKSDNTLFYICGPLKMKNNIKTILKSMGVLNKNIFIEDFFW